MISIDSFLHSALVTTLLVYSQYVVLRSGVFSVATAGLASIGAYTLATLTVSLKMPTLAAAAIAILLSAAVSALLGLLISRLRGTYQAIATLGFVLVVQQITTLWEPVTGGTFGIYGTPQWGTIGVLAAIVVVVAVTVTWLDRHRLGQQQAAARMDEQAAASCGVDVARVRLSAVVLSGALAGVAGVSIAGSQFSIDPSAFGFDLIVGTLAGAIIGGYRNAAGPILGSIVVAVPPIVLGGLASYQSVVTGLLTLFVLALAPRGISSLRLWRSSAASRKGTPDSGDVLPAETLVVGNRTSKPLEVEHISRRFGGLVAVGDVSFTLRPGEIVGLIGPNGAGKSTVVGLVSGSLRLDRGSVQMGDSDLSARPSFQVTRSGVARTFQTVRLFTELTVAENVKLAAMTCHPGDRAAVHAMVPHLLRAAGIEPLADRSAGTLPYTDQRRVEIARALATSPSFILLDEPAAGMTEMEAQELAVLVRSIATAGIGVLVIDHNVSWILGLCERVLVQNAGLLIAKGSPNEVQNDPQVKEAYLG